MNLPNQLSLGRLCLCVIFTVFLEVKWQWSGSVAFAIFVFASLTDWLDGYLARRMNLITDLGKLLDPLADKILIAAAYIGFVGHGMAPLWVVICIISREFLITGLRTLAAAKGTVLAAEKIGKHKTISQMVTALIGLAILALQQLGVYPIMMGQAKAYVLEPMLYVTLGITVYSGVVYFSKNFKLVLVEK